MAITITVPRLGWSMEEGTFAGWLKQDGDPINQGDRLFLLESEKATEEIETLDAGLLHIPPDAPQPGDKVKVGQVLGYLLAPGEAPPAAVVERQPVAAAPTEPAQPVAGPSARRLARSLEVNIGQVVGSGRGGRITEADIRQHSPAAPPSRRQPAISPRARRVAAELGVDWTELRGSGRNGRIRERDVRAAPVSRGGRTLPHTDMRRTIASRMVAGVTQAAPVTLTTRADATNLVNLRDQFKAATAPDDIVPSYTDLVVKLTAVALRRHPLLQAQWREDGLFVPDDVAIGIAVDTEGGLLVPVIREADRLTLRQIAAQSRDLIARARARRLTGEQMRGGTFTITNLGGLGIDAFTPILQLPQCAVLGVGRIVREPAVVGEHIVPRERMTLSLTFDHRVVDGAPAARFLDMLRGCLEQPTPWLLP